MQAWQCSVLIDFLCISIIKIKTTYALVGDIIISEESTDSVQISEPP